MYQKGTDAEGNRTTIEINNWNVGDVIQDMVENRAVYQFRAHPWNPDLKARQYRMFNGLFQFRDDFDGAWSSDVDVQLPNDNKKGALFAVGSWSDFDYAQGWNEGMSTEDTKNLAYWERNMLALLLAEMLNNVRWLGVNGWFDHQGEGFEGWSRVISLDSGAITFHVPDDFDLGDLPKIEPNWDGHTTAEKWAYVRELCGIDSNPSSN